jgi:hypothetical protein
MRLQRVCSSPSPFPNQEIPAAIDALTLLPKHSNWLRVISESRLRARSPLPSRPILCAKKKSRPIPKVFAEAKSDSKRFSTPLPPQESLSPTRGAPRAAAPLRAPGKVKHKKKGHWDNARARVAALKVLDRWTVDLSKLLIGEKFAAGAHCCLRHGIYKEVCCC